MRRLFSRDSPSEFAEPPGRMAIACSRLRAVGLYPLFFCFVSCIGLIIGALFGETLVPGKSNVHFISFEDTPVWFLIAMSINAVVAFFSAGYIWFRVLGR